MAVDDIVSVITINMAQNDTTDRQPGAGVEEMFLAPADTNYGGSAPNSASSTQLRLIDGTNIDSTYYNMQATGQAARIYLLGRYVATNTNYFRITHEGATTGDYGFTTIVIG